MGKNESTKATRIGLFTAGGLMMISASLYWICDIGTIFALCLASAGLCFFGAGFSIKDNEKQR